MANYYTKASLEVDLQTVENATYAMNALEEMEKFLESSIPLWPNITKDTLMKYNWSSPHILFLARDMEIQDRDCIGFDCTAEDTKLWIRADENIDVDQCAHFLQHLIIHFNLKPVGFAWSDDCSKNRLDAFGGGAIFITADSMEFINTSNWLYEQQKAYDAL